MLHFIHTNSLTDKNLLTSARPSQETCCEDNNKYNNTTYYSTTLHSHTSDQHIHNPSIMWARRQAN